MIRTTFGTPMARGAIALFLNTAINAALGFGFWVAAARLYSTSTVGLASAMVSALLLSAGLGWMGLQFVLIRYLPVAGRDAGRLFGACSGAAVAIATVASVVLIVSPSGSDLGFAASVPAGAALVAAAAVWVVFSLQDAALIGLRRAAIVPAGNAVFGVLKLLGVVLLATSDQPGPIFGAWVVSAAAVGVVRHWLVLRPAFRALSEAPGLPPRSDLIRFGAGQHLGAVATALPDWIVPLLIVALLGEVENAQYYAAWTVSFAFRLVAVNLANAFTVQASVGPDQAPQAGRELRRLAPLAIVPLVAVSLLGADALMAIFGEGYGPGAAVLRWFGVGLIPFAAVTLLVAGQRVRSRSAPAVLVGLLTSGTTIGLDLILLPAWGIEATAMAWTVAWAVAFLVLAARRRAGRGDSSSLPSVTTKRPLP